MSEPHWAMDYLGKPWVNGATGPDAYDCYGLVVAAYRDMLGETLPIFSVAASEPLRLRRLMADNVEPDSPFGWYREVVPSELDAVLLSHGERPHHVGLWTNADGGRVVHSLEGVGVVAESLATLNLGAWKVLGYFSRRVSP